MRRRRDIFGNGSGRMSGIRNLSPAQLVTRILGILSVILAIVMLVNLNRIMAAMAVFAFPDVTLTERLIGFFSVSLPLFAITLAVPGAFGGGDIKLMAVIGFFLGWKMSLTAFMLAVFSGGIYGIGLLLSKKKGAKEHFAFGPFLCAGTALTLFVGEWLLSWYLSIIF